MPVYETNLYEECPPDSNERLRLEWETNNDGSVYWELVNVLILIFHSESIRELNRALRRLHEAVEAVESAAARLVEAEEDSQIDGSADGSTEGELGEEEELTEGEELSEKGPTQPNEGAGEE
jgi:hypothetical protein